MISAFLTNHRTTIIVVLLIILLSISGYFGYLQYKKSKSKSKSKEEQKHESESESEPKPKTEEPENVILTSPSTEEHSTTMEAKKTD